MFFFGENNMILFMHVGLATDLKTVPADVIKARVLRTGDGSHKYSKLAKDPENPLDNNNYAGSPLTADNVCWGYGDEAMTDDDMKNIVILNREVD